MIDNGKNIGRMTTVNCHKSGHIGRFANTNDEDLPTRCPEQGGAVSGLTTNSVATVSEKDDGAASDLDAVQFAEAVIEAGGHEGAGLRALSRRLDGVLQHGSAGRERGDGMVGKPVLHGGISVHLVRLRQVVGDRGHDGLLVPEFFRGNCLTAVQSEADGELVGAFCGECDSFRGLWCSSAAFGYEEIAEEKTHETRYRFEMERHGLWLSLWWQLDEIVTGAVGKARKKRKCGEECMSENQQID